MNPWFLSSLTEYFVLVYGLDFVRRILGFCGFIYPKRVCRKIQLSAHWLSRGENCRVRIKDFSRHKTQKERHKSQVTSHNVSRPNNQIGCNLGISTHFCSRTRTYLARSNAAKGTNICFLWSVCHICWNILLEAEACRRSSSWCRSLFDASYS